MSRMRFLKSSKNNIDFEVHKYFRYAAFMIYYVITYNNEKPRPKNRSVVL
jgi:hypothetical protein